VTDRIARTVETAVPERSRASALAQTLLRSEWPWMLYLAFVILLVVFSFASPWFLSIDNFLNIGRQTTLVSIVAIGMTFVIIAGQIDLSVASTLALSGMAAALAMAHLANFWFVGALAGLSTGALVGLINGALTTRLAIPSFLVTLGTLSAARGQPPLSSASSAAIPVPRRPRSSLSRSSETRCAEISAAISGSRTNSRARTDTLPRWT